LKELLHHLHILSLEIPLDISVTILLRVRAGGLRDRLLAPYQIVKFLPANELILLEEE